MTTEHRIEQRLIAEIFLADKKGQKIDETRGKPGTGYALTSEWLLTARHVVEEAGKKLDPRRVFLRWYDPTRGARSWHRLEDRDAIVELGEDFDAVLIRFSAPDGVPLRHGICERPPGSGADWFTLAFPDVSRAKEAGAGPLSFGGATRQETGPRGEFGLLIADKASKLSNWRGASGSPVFVGREIIGLITERDRDGELSDRLWGLSTHKLFTDSKAFRDRILPPAATHEQIETALTRLLEKTHKVLTALLPVLRQAKALPAKGAPSAEAVAEALLTAEDFTSVRYGLEGLYEDYDQEEDYASREVLWQIYCRVMAVNYHPAAARAFARAQASAPCEAVLVDAVTELGAEMIMAGIDGLPPQIERRAVELTAGEGADGILYGLNALPAPPESGIDPQGAVASLEVDLQQLLGRVVGPDYLKRFSPENLKGRVRTLLDERRRRGRGSRTPYVVFKFYEGQTAASVKPHYDFVAEQIQTGYQGLVRTILLKYEGVPDVEAIQDKEIRELDFFILTFGRRLDDPHAQSGD